MKLFLENVRSFEGWHEIPIAPATVLLGENSAGKSTLLAMLAAVHQAGFPFKGNFFNESPFELGNFKTIASQKRGVEHFSVGIQTSNSTIIAGFIERNGLPVLAHVFATDDFHASGDSVALDLVTQELRHIDRAQQLGWQEKEILIEKTTVKELANGEASIWLNRMSCLAFAPMRSRPKRTYDQLSDAFSSEGDHVPLMLARATDPNNKQAAALHDAIQSFGKYSEMFSDIGVKQLGRGSGDPFQVQVKVGSKQTNLMDVGYGVSQVLPLIVDAQRASPNTTLLLQQPEVHLHPKAQAALGSMVKDWVSKSKKTVVVETHSDYLLDRLRLEVKRGNLKTEQLKIFFLEKVGSQTKLHALDVDAQGNVLNAPEGYRDFFLREQMALLVD